MSKPKVNRPKVNKVPVNKINNNGFGNNRSFSTSTRLYRTSLVPTKGRNNDVRFAIIDISTFTEVKEGITKFTPYHVGVHTGNLLSTEQFSCWYLTDYSNPAHLMSAVFDYLFKGHLFDGAKIFGHNLAKFDAVILLEYLLAHPLCRSVIPIRNASGIYLGFNIQYGQIDSKTTKTLYLRDSLHLLPASLANLTKSFNVGEDAIKGGFST
uniref:Probable DNA polymerase n=1 Tax=Spizellomyces punctatus TaxID=109760 RepID=Q950Q2_SPIPN|nr:orf209 [Spizellomyces punctatus]AAK84256.1 orf209 [Spizellomyces punctatus]